MSKDQELIELRKDKARLDFAEKCTIDGYDGCWFVRGQTYFGKTLRQSLDEAMARKTGEKR